MGLKFHGLSARDDYSERDYCQFFQSSSKFQGSKLQEQDRVRVTGIIKKKEKKKNIYYMIGIDQSWTIYQDPYIAMEQSSSSGTFSMLTLKTL